MIYLIFQGNVIFDDRFSSEVGLINNFNLTHLKDLCRICHLFASNTELVKNGSAQCLPYGLYSFELSLAIKSKWFLLQSLSFQCSLNIAYSLVHVHYICLSDNTFLLHTRTVVEVVIYFCCPDSYFVLFSLCSDYFFDEIYSHMHLTNMHKHEKKLTGVNHY